MLCDDVVSLVYSYLTQLRVSAVNAEILRRKNLVLQKIIETFDLKDRWEEWVEYGDTTHVALPEVYGPEAKYGAEDLMLQNLHNWFFR